MHDIEWDTTMCQNKVSKNRLELEKLYQTGLKRKLEIDEENRFKDEIKVIACTIINLLSAILRVIYICGLLKMWLTLPDPIV